MIRLPFCNHHRIPSFFEEFSIVIESRSLIMHFSAFALPSAFVFATRINASPLLNPRGAQPDYPGYPYNACWTDLENGAGRTLFGDSVFNDNMTQEACGAYCSGLTSPSGTQYVYFGLEYGRECYCGNQIASGATLAPGGESDCNTPCSGDDNEDCGAGNRINIWVCTDG